VTADTAIMSNKSGIPHQSQILEVQMLSHAVHLRPWTSLRRGVASPLLSKIPNLHLNASSSQAKVLADVTCVLAKLPMMTSER